MTETWKLVGFDTFEGEHYPLEGAYTTEEDAQLAGRARLVDLEITQPAHGSGGQNELGIQDRVFVQRPDGSLYRFIPVPQEPTQTGQ